jgi:hypothetical protein
MPTAIPNGTPLPVGATINPLSLRATMESRRAQGERFALDEALAIVIPLCTELAREHAQGKNFFTFPSAIVIRPGSTPEIEHVAASAMPSLPRDKSCLAPEERAGKAGGARASVFSIGAIFYEMLTSESVGPGMRRPTDLVPDLPTEVEVVLSKALVSDPAHRPDDLNALASAMHTIRPSASLQAPPPGGSLDEGDDFEVDIRLSMVPPAPTAAAPVIPKAARAPDIGAMGVMIAPSAQPKRDATSQLADLKARLESDPRPRYVVVEGGMDHGPFSAIELLQQIGNHNFTDDSILRDTFSKEERAIKDWPEFAPFAEQTRLHREIKAEKVAIEKVIVEEKKATTSKALIGGGVIAAILAVGGLWFVKSQVSKNSGLQIDDQQAVTVDVDGGVKGGKGKGPGGPGGPGGGRLDTAGGRPVLPSGLSCEGARSKYTEELKLDGKQPDISAGSYGAKLNQGTYLNSCGVPAGTKVSICAAIQNGRAVGVTVSLTPSDPGKAGCVAGAVRGMSFPSSPSLDVTTTTFE